jgi:RHS repeat-associated core domain
VNNIAQPAKITHFIYNPDGILTIHRNSTMTVPLTDHIKNTRVVLSTKIHDIGTNGTTQLTSTTPVEKYRYFPFEAITTHSNNLSNYLYTEQEFNSETNLHNYRTHIMKTDELERFFSMDPQHQLHSPYTYARNNPIVYTDPDGQWFG